MRSFKVFLFLSLINFSLTCYSLNSSFCGPRCLFIVFKKLGIETTLDELIKLSGYDEKKGTSMYGLYRAVRKKGLYAEGMKIGVNDLAKLKIPAIAYLWNNHFVVVEGTNTETLIITDPPNKSFPMHKDKFRGIYSGFSLLISKNKNLFPQIESKGPDIRFSKYTYDFGKVEPGNNRKIEHIFKFRNVGKEELRIYRVRTTCGCTAALISSKVIPANGKGEIKVSFSIKGRRGFQRHKVYVHTNDPITPLVQLQIKGIIKTELKIFPEEVNFGEIRKSKLPVKKVYITEPEGEKLKIKKVISSSKFILTEISKSRRKYYKGYEIKVSLNSKIPIGELKEKMVIYTNYRKKPKIEIPIIGEIKGDIEVYPSVMFFGFVKGKELIKRSIIISTISKAPLRIKNIENNLKFLTLRIITKKKDKEYEITGILKNAPYGNIKGEIIVWTNNPEQPKIKIPVSGYVKK